MIRPGVLAAFWCVLTLATSAHAECVGAVELVDRGQSHVLDAFANKADCVAAGTAYVERMKQKGHDPTYLCLPDTVDPRGLKGK